MYTNMYISSPPSVNLSKFADDTLTPHRYRDNNLELSAVKTTEMIVNVTMKAPLTDLVLLSSFIKKVQQRMYFFWQLKTFNQPNSLRAHSYSSITWTHCTMQILLLKKMIRCNPPSLQDPNTSRMLIWAMKINVDPSHPRHNLFVSLLSGRKLGSSTD